MTLTEWLSDCEPYPRSNLTLEGRRSRSAFVWLVRGRVVRR